WRHLSDWVLLRRLVGERAQGRLAAQRHSGGLARRDRCGLLLLRNTLFLGFRGLDLVLRFAERRLLALARISDRLRHDGIDVVLLLACERRAVLDLQRDRHAILLRIGGRLACRAGGSLRWLGRGNGKFFLLLARVWHLGFLRKAGGD